MSVSHEGLLTLIFYFTPHTTVHSALFQSSSQPTGFSCGSQRICRSEEEGNTLAPTDMTELGIYTFVRDEE